MAEITQALSVTPVDVGTLRRMAISEGGLLTDEIRRKVWPRLLNVLEESIPEELGGFVVVEKNDVCVCGQPSF